MTTFTKSDLKSRLFILFLLCAGGTTFVQDIAVNPSGTQQYLKIGLDAGTAKNFGIHFSLLTSEKRFYSVDFNHISRNPRFIPTDYYGEFLCFFGDCIPNDEIQLYGIIRRSLFCKQA